MFILKLIEWLEREKPKTSTVSTAKEDMAFLSVIGAVVLAIVLIDMLL